MSERLQISVSSAVYIQGEDQTWLFVQQARPEKMNKWGPVGGGFKLADRDPRGTAIRETREEIGVEPELISLLGVYNVKRPDYLPGIAFAFIGKLPLDARLLVPNPEISRAEYLTQQQIDKLRLADQLYKPEYTLPCLRDLTLPLRFPLSVFR